MNRIFKFAAGAAGAVLALSATAGPAQAQRYDGNRYHGGGSQRAVSACVDRAERSTRGRVRVTDVDRRGDGRFRVRGVIDRYGRHDNRGRTTFACSARGNGRITGFDINRRRW